MQTYHKARSAKKLTKAEILDYYRTLAYPDTAPGGKLFVPPDLRLKAFEKLLQWQGVTAPATVTDDLANVKYVLEIRRQD